MQEWLIFSSSKNMFCVLRGQEIYEKKNYFLRLTKRLEKNAGVVKFWRFMPVAQRQLPILHLAHPPLQRPLLLLE